MERDFLGVGCSNVKPSWEENARPLAGVGFPPRLARNKRSISGLFPTQHSSAAPAFGGPRRSYPEMQPQQRFDDGAGRRGIQNPLLSAHRAWNNSSFNALQRQNPNARAFPVASSYGIPITAATSFFKRPDPANGSRPPAAYAASSCKEVSKPKQAQMTIFYRGEVNVYDNIPIDKAQEIMFLAANGSRITFNNASMKGRTPDPASDDVAGTRCLDFSKGLIHRIGPASPESVTSHSVVLQGTRGSSRCFALDFAGLSLDIARAPSALSSNDKALSMKAVPLARKASLLRFLEKRKERIANVSPYIAGQESLHAGGMAADEAGYSRYSFDSGMTLASGPSTEWRLGMSGEDPCAVRPSRYA